MKHLKALDFRDLTEISGRNFHLLERVLSSGDQGTWVLGVIFIVQCWEGNFSSLQFPHLKLRRLDPMTSRCPPVSDIQKNSMCWAVWVMGPASRCLKSWLRCGQSLWCRTKIPYFLQMCLYGNLERACWLKTKVPPWISQLIELLGS